MTTSKRKAQLRVATEGDKPARPTTVTEAAENGTPLDELKAIRSVISRAIDSPNTSPRDLAALTRRQLEVSREIRALEEQATRKSEESNVVTEREWRPEAI